MDEGYRPGSRDDHRYRRSSPGYDDGDHGRDRGHEGDSGYYRSRNDAPTPPRNLNYDDNDDGLDEKYHNSDRYRGGGRKYSGSYNRADSHGRSRSPGRRPRDGSRYSGEKHESYPSRRHNHHPGKTIVISDVPEQTTEQDILYGLDYVTEDRYMSSDQVVRARFDYDQTDRRIALVDFRRREDAEYFMNKYQPNVSFPLQHSSGRSSKVLTFDIYLAERGEGEQLRGQRSSEKNWFCAHCRADNYPHRDACYKCKVPRPMEDDVYGYNFGVPSGPILTGETDECPQGGQSQYLVVRDLAPSVTEEILSKGVMKLFKDNTTEPTRGPANPQNKLKSTAPTHSTVGLGAKPGSLRRVFLMRDRQSDESRNYGFAEFTTLEDAIRAMAKYRGYGDTFTIASKIAKVGFIHSGVFVPADPSTDPMFTFAPIVNPALRLRYWDERVYPSVFDVAIEPLPEPPSADTKAEKSDAALTDKTNTGTKSFKQKKSKKELENAAPIKITMNPEIQRWTMKSVELHSSAKNSTDEGALGDGKIKGVGLGAVSQINEETAEERPAEPVLTRWDDQYVSYADWDNCVCILCDMAAPSQEIVDAKAPRQYTRDDILIDHEVRVHHCYQDPAVKEKAAALLSALNKEPRTILTRKPRLKSEPLPTYISYSDFDLLRCLICRRQFKTIDLLWLHEQESELHKRLLSDTENITRAVQQLAIKGKTQHRMAPDRKTRQQQEEQQPHYRDRAKERRQAFRQPNKPATTTTANSNAPGDKNKEPEPVPEEVPVAKKSKGAGMLAKMGWTAGAGLGAEGTGRTEAIAVDAFAEGVGLGAEGYRLGDASEEAARKTKGNPSDFVEKTRDKARERFERLQERLQQVADAQGK